MWTVSMIILTPILMFISNVGASGGEQKPLITLATMIVVTLYGLTTLSISSAIIFRHWFKRNWWYVFVIAITIIPTAMDIWDNYSTNPYSFSETTQEINGDTVLTKTEFYNESDFKKIRSISFWGNNKKDSIWVTYSDKGDIIKRETYLNDTLVTK